MTMKDAKWMSRRCFLIETYESMYMIQLESFVDPKNFEKSLQVA